MIFLRRIGKILLWTMFGLVLLSLLMMLAVRQPSVQTWLTGKAAGFLSKSLNTTVTVGGVDIDFFKTAVLEDIFIADRQADTLLYARRLSADIGVFNLMASEIYLNKIGLDSAVVRLRRSTADSIFNYQFIIDGLTGDSPKDTTAGTPWTFGIGEVALKNVCFRMHDEGEGRFDLTTKITTLNVAADELDFENQTIALDELSLNDSEVVFRQLEKAPETEQPATKLEFPGFGWTITTDKIRLENNHLAYLDDNSPRLENALDYSHLNLQDATLSIDDFRYADDGILADINRVSFRDDGGFQLNKLAGEVQVLPKKIEVKNLVLQTPYSDFHNDTRLVFNEFSDLTDFLDRVNTQSDFAESRLGVRDLLMLAPALRDVENIRFPEEEILNFEGKIGLNDNRLAVESFTFSVGEKTRLQASGSIGNLTAEPRYDLQIAQLSTSYSSLKTFTRNVDLPPALKNFGQISLSGKVAGTLGDLSASSLKLNTQSATRFSGDLQVKGLPDMDQAVFDLKIKDLATRSTDLRGFSENPLPPQADSLGLVQFAGKFHGTIRDFDIAGQFKTSAGGAETDLALRFSEDYSYARYTGRLAMEDFDLGKLLGDTLQIGEVSLNTELNGEGLSLDTLNTTMDGLVKKMVFRGYEYRNLQVNGRFVQRLFEGKMKMQDENLGFDLLGKVNLNDSLPDLDVTVSIDTVNFKNLNLSQVNIGLSGKVDANLVGNNLDNLKGRATLTDFALSGEEDHYFDKKIVLQAQQLGGGNRALLFDAEFLKARVEGRYNFGDLPDLVIGYVNDFFPVEELALPPDSLLTPSPDVADQEFSFDFQFTNLAAVASIFLPGFSAVDTSAYLKGSFNSAEKQLDLTGVFVNIKYQDNSLDSLILTMSGNRRRLKSSTKLRNFNLGGTFYAPFFDFNTRMGGDTLRFDLAVLDDSLQTNFKWGGRSTETQENYKLVFDRELVLNRESWAIAPENAIYFARKELTINDLIFTKNKQSVSVQTAGTAPPDDLAPVEVRFDNFRLSEISGLLNNPDLRLEGALDGKFMIKEPLKNLHYNAGVLVDALSLNDQLLGNLQVDASQPAGQRIVEIYTGLSGANELNLNGTYGLETNEFDIKANLGRLSMVVADPFLNELIRNTEGYVTGNFTLTGTPDKPALNGSITTHGVSTEVVLSGTRYRTNENTITFSEKEIDLGQLLLNDDNNRKATLTGKIRHAYFNDIEMDMRAQTDGLQILNTTREDNELYYGKLFAKADVQITGTPELPRLDVRATTLDSSLLHVEPLTTDLAVVQEDYIIFANPNNYEPDSLNQLERQIGAGAGGFDLNLVLEVTPQARLNIIIDPLTGDELFCSGSGNFIIRMNTAGDLSITGSYVIEEGSYSFNYEGLVKRNFEIRKGSSLTFTGDPYDARFDITAVYKTRATTYELISNEATLNEATLAASQRRTEVEVLMNIDGGLADPSITFDINLPANQGGLVESLTARKLSDLRDDPTELNKQVFGLLFFNSFIQSETGAGLAGVGESAALKSVSSLITSQLNKFADRYIKGVDLTLGFESYRTAGQETGTVTELQVGLSKQLFNNRLTIRVGGNFNLENTQQSSLQPGGYSAIAGDFVLEYKLNERGNYLLKVFHKSDYNILLDANTTRTGVGVMFRKSY